MGGVLHRMGTPRMRVEAKPQMRGLLFKGSPEQQRQIRPQKLTACAMPLPHAHDHELLPQGPCMPLIQKGIVPRRERFVNAIPPEDGRLWRGMETSAHDPISATMIEAVF